MEFYIYISIYKTFVLDNSAQKTELGRIKKMEAAFVEEMKSKLKEQKSTILASLAEQSDDMRSLVKTVESGDEADVAADAIDRTLLTSLGSQEAIRLQQIENALERIATGKYGYCLKCGKEIPEERLRAIPYAFMCVQCATVDERRNR